MHSNSAPAFDPQRFKALTRAGFNRIAERYADGARVREELTLALLDLAALQTGERVLDLASGPGLLAGHAARQVGPKGLVVASDYAEKMLVQLRESSDAAPIVAVAMDAEQMACTTNTFDVVLVGLALFLFPNPSRALQEVRRVLRPGGRLVLSVWGPRHEVALAFCAQDAIARTLPPPRITPPSIYRLGTAPVLQALFVDNGFCAPRLQPCHFSVHFASVDAYWQGFLDLAGGAAEALARLPETSLVQLRANLASDLAPYGNPAQGFDLPAGTLLASAVRAP